MRRTHSAPFEPSRQDIDAAIAAMSAEQLRELVLEMLLGLDDRVHGRVVSAIISRAARGGSGWAQAALGEAEVAEAAWP
jgi:hypothetical protein